MTTNKDFIIVLAWPEGMCKLAGSWYDFIFGKKLEARGGHAAIVLINSITKDLYYMDNGRYHAPLGFARIRDEETDPDVKIHTQAEIRHDKILNIDKVLVEIANNSATHGEGTLYASVLNNINFDEAYSYAKKPGKRSYTLWPFYNKWVQLFTFCSVYNNTFISTSYNKNAINVPLLYYSNTQKEC